MRLWHKDLIDSLPRKQLLGQWRECCAIIKNIKEKGTPNHLLVNKIMDYDLKHFYTYGLYVFIETEHRDYKCNLRKFDQYFNDNVIGTVHENVHVRKKYRITKRFKGTI
jgi:uncharacterized protein (TIGR02328 family)